jgi:hypothetical protein
MYVYGRKDLDVDFGLARKKGRRALSRRGGKATFSLQEFRDVPGLENRLLPFYHAQGTIKA